MMGHVVPGDDPALAEAYFLYHSIGLYPGKARDIALAMAEFAQVWGRADDAQWAFLLDRRQKFIDRWRAILKAPPGSVTTCESVTQGLHMILSALPAAHLKGRTVLVAADCFPSNHFLLQRMARSHGFTLRTVPIRAGAAHVEDEDFLDAWTPDVGLALLTWVSSTTSQRIDLAALVARGRRMGSLIGVDITQGAGLLPFDVMAPEVDFVLSTSLKWMCGTPGAGALYLSPRLVGHCDPEPAGWFSQPDPFNWNIDAFSLAPDIRRFDSGTPGCMSAIASLPALDWHAAQDTAALLRKNRRIVREIIDIADEIGISVATPRASDRRGGSVMLRLDDALPAARLLDDLRHHGIAADARGQILRLSPGWMTADAGVTRLRERLIATRRP